MVAGTGLTLRKRVRKRAVPTNPANLVKPVPAQGTQDEEPGLRGGDARSGGGLGQMAREIQKGAERQVLHRIVTALALTPDNEPEAGEAPDFIIQMRDQ